MPMVSEMPAEEVRGNVAVVAATECATRVTTSAIQAMRKSWRALSAATPAATNGAAVQRMASVRRIQRRRNQTETGDRVGADAPVKPRTSQIEAHAKHAQSLNRSS